MTNDGEFILKRALELSDEDRAELAAALLESIEPVPDPGVEEAWRVEVERRMAELDAGTVKTVPWEEVRDRLYAKLNARKN